MNRSAPYVARYVRDPDDDAWLVSVDGQPGCQTYGRSLRQARARIREALAAWLDRDPASLAVTDCLPADLEAISQQVAHRRSEADEAGTAAEAVAAQAARDLAARGLSRTDAAAILGVSHQRVQRLLAS